MSRPIDRLQYAAQICRGKRVLDIGGAKTITVGADPTTPFARAYSRIQQVCTQHGIVDMKPGADYTMNLSNPDSIPKLHEAIAEYEPEVILCMEILEHVNCHFEIMCEIAQAVKSYGSVAFITVPNNGNWILNALGWGSKGHILAFFKRSARLFIMRSPLGELHVTMHACIGKYLWYWWVTYVVALFQPISWGFTIRPKTGLNRSKDGT